MNIYIYNYTHTHIYIYIVYIYIYIVYTRHMPHTQSAQSHTHGSKMGIIYHNIYYVCNHEFKSLSFKISL